MHRVVRWAALLLLVTGSACYTYVNVEDIPWHCSPILPPVAPLRLDPAPGPRDELTLLGRVVVLRSSYAEPGPAQVLLEGPRAAGAVTDSAGWFAIDSLPAGRYMVKTSRVGYATRQDSITWPLPEPRTFVIPLEPQSLNLHGPCGAVSSFGFRRPWWKVW